MYTVYILYSKNHDRLYIGMTSNLSERLRSHNELGKKGYTKRYRPWTLIHQEEFATKAAALQREKALKGGQGRAWIRKTFLT